MLLFLTDIWFSLNVREDYPDWMDDVVKYIQVHINISSSGLMQFTVLQHLSPLYNYISKDFGHYKMNKSGLINTHSSLIAVCTFTPKFGRLWRSCCERDWLEGDYSCLLSSDLRGVKRFILYPRDKSINTFKIGND